MATLNVGYVNIFLGDDETNDINNNYEDSQTCINSLMGREGVNLILGEYYFVGTIILTSVTAFNNNWITSGTRALDNWAISLICRIVS
jgi:hypothetical protein